MTRRGGKVKGSQWESQGNEEIKEIGPRYLNEKNPHEGGRTAEGLIGENLNGPEDCTEPIKNISDEDGAKGKKPMCAENRTQGIKNCLRQSEELMGKRRGKESG